MSILVDNILDERRKTHGDFGDHSRVTQNIKRAMRDSPNWGKLSDMQRESLEMIAHKIGRILAGNPDFQDHWSDLVGYGRLVEQRLDVPGTVFPNFSAPVGRAS